MQISFKIFFIFVFYVFVFFKIVNFFFNIYSSFHFLFYESIVNLNMFLLLFLLMFEYERDQKLKRFVIIIFKKNSRSFRCLFNLNRTKILMFFFSISFYKNSTTRENIVEKSMQQRNENLDCLKFEQFDAICW